MQTPTKRKRPRTASKEVRRRQLIEATIDSIAENGLSGTTMAAVTSRADLSLGSVSFHFESKENLLKETLIFLAEEHRSCWADSLKDSALRPKARLLAMVGAHFHPSICTRKRIAVWFAFFGESRYRAIYREWVTSFDVERVDISERVCRELVEDGGYRDVDPMDVAKSIECFADGLWLSLLLYPDSLNPQAARRQIEKFLESKFSRHFKPARPVLYHEYR